MTREGVDIVTVTELMGHASLETTRLYMRHTPGSLLNRRTVPTGAETITKLGQIWFSDLTNKIKPSRPVWSVLSITSRPPRRVGRKTMAPSAGKAQLYPDNRLAVLGVF